MSADAFKNISDLLQKCADGKLLTEAHDFVVGCIAEANELMDSLVSFPEGDYAVKQKCRDIVFQIRLVLMSMLEESKDLKAFRLVCLDGLHVIGNEFKFRSVTIEDFLKEERLEKYTDIFTDEGIAKAYELFDPDIIIIDELSGKMKPAPYKRLRERLRKTESGRKYIADKMMSDLDRASVKCEETSKVVIGKLEKSIDDLKREAAELVKSIEKGKSRKEFKKFLLQVVSKIAQIVMWYHAAVIGATVIKSGASAAAVAARTGVPIIICSLKIDQCASEEIKVADNDLAAMDQVLDRLKDETGQMDKQLQQSMMIWKMAMVSFTDLLDTLKESGQVLKEEELHDVDAHITYARTTLQTLDTQIGEFEEKVKEAVKI